MNLSMSWKTLYERISQLEINPNQYGAILLKFSSIILKILSSSIWSDILGNCFKYFKKPNLNDANKGVNPFWTIDLYVN